jgi:hypothetical protein
MVASALACGEVTSDEVEDEPTTAGNAGVTSNPPYPGGVGGGISVNPPYPGTGGTGGVNMPGTSGAGAGGIYPGTGGTFSNPPVLFPCPDVLPVDDSSCATGHLFGRYPPVCAYESDGCASTQAVCNTQTVKWQVEACDGGASNSGGAGGSD